MEAGILYVRAHGEIETADRERGQADEGGSRLAGKQARGGGIKWGGGGGREEGRGEKGEGGREGKREGTGRQERVREARRSDGGGEGIISICV